jgi:hypothetical protein
MKMSSLMDFGLPLVSLLLWSHTGAAQHHPAAHKARPTAAIPHPQRSVQGGGGMTQPSPAMQRQMQKQMQAMMQEQMKQQEQMLKAQQQTHEQHMLRFREWAAANGLPSSQGQGNGAGELPSSRAALQNWLRTQKHNKATGKSYDPQYDQYLAFQKEHHGKAKTSASGATALTKHQSLPRTAGISTNASISLLRTVHLKLQTADHDYDGHRVRAMHHIGSALDHLGSSSPPTSGTSQTSGSLAQAQSDAILQDALSKLQIVHSQLSTNGAIHQHAGAEGAVSSAMRELHIALNIR